MTVEGSSKHNNVNNSVLSIYDQRRVPRRRKHPPTIDKVNSATASGLGSSTAAPLVYQSSISRSDPAYFFYYSASGTQPMMPMAPMGSQSHLSPFLGGRPVYCYIPPTHASLMTNPMTSSAAAAAAAAYTVVAPPTSTASAANTMTLLSLPTNGLVNINATLTLTATVTASTHPLPVDPSTARFPTTNTTAALLSPPKNGPAGNAATMVVSFAHATQKQIDQGRDLLIAHLINLLKITLPRLRKSSPGDRQFEDDYELLITSRQLLIQLFIKDFSPTNFSPIFQRNYSAFSSPKLKDFSPTGSSHAPIFQRNCSPFSSPKLNEICYFWFLYENEKNPEKKQFFLEQIKALEEQITTTKGEKKLDETIRHRSAIELEFELADFYDKCPIEQRPFFQIPFRLFDHSNPLFRFPQSPILAEGLDPKKMNCGPFLTSIVHKLHNESISRKQEKYFEELDVHNRILRGALILLRHFKSISLKHLINLQNKTKEQTKEQQEISFSNARRNMVLRNLIFYHANEMIEVFLVTDAIKKLNETAALEDESSKEEVFFARIHTIAHLKEKRRQMFNQLLATDIAKPHNKMTEGILKDLIEGRNKKPK